MNTQIYEEAAHWLVQFRAEDVDGAARRMFDEWLRASPQHVRAYLEVASIWNDGSELDRLRRFREADRQALATPEGTVVPWLPHEIKHRRSLRAFFTIKKVSIAASLLLGVLAAAGAAYWQRGLYSTGIGEQRSFALSDGSTVQLNSHSTLRVRYGDNVREIDLIKGQALFGVAQETSRPFIVRAGDAQVKAVGTQFDVYRKRDATVVTVIEGRVAVSSWVLSAGEQVTLKPQIAAAPIRANPATVIAWTQRQLVFETTPLAEVAQEFNRYNARPLVVGTEALGQLQISAVFSSTDSASLVSFLRARPDLRVTETDDAIHVLPR